MAMTPNEYNQWASTRIWTTDQLPRTWTGKKYAPASDEFASAVKSFQVQVSLRVDGKLGPITWHEMQIQLGRETYGLDISQYQGDVDFQEVAKDPRDFQYVVIKATEGQDWTDPWLKRNACKAKDAGFSIMYYHFGTPQTIKPGKTPSEDAIAEADDFLKALDGLPDPVTLSFTSQNGRRMASVWLDLEKSVPNLTREECHEWIEAWIGRVEAAGRFAGLYTSKQWLEAEASLFERLVDRPDRTIRPIWVARYGQNIGRPQPQYDPNEKVPECWGIYDIWQYTSRGLVAGIDGNVDLDLATVLANVT